MGRKSVREDKSVYQQAREEANYTRAEASEKMEYVSDDRIDKIERGVIEPKAEDVLAMATCYHRPDLCNYFCSHQCRIGREYVPEVKMQDLSRIVLEAIASLNRLDEEKNRIIEIAVDGTITEDEYSDFSRIQEELNNVSMAIAALQLWVDKSVADGSINENELIAAKEQLQKQQHVK